MPGTNDSLGAPRDRGEALLMQVRDAAAGGETHAGTFDEPWTRQEALLMQIRDAIAAGGEGGCGSGISLGYDEVGDTSYLSVIEGGSGSQGISIGYDNVDGVSYLSVIEG